ncbi:MAG: prepilin peptidase [Deltaproteobacteria bacterium]|nr:prepilin peptidase [Deltaproteobacteria bacterium]MDL1961494.1 prepilin peptidase [Deltaproteobacteria bacterium]
MIVLSTFTWPFLVFLLGTCIGSFLNVCICRLPQDRSVVKPGSACPKCGHMLKWWENIPILSFLFLRAKCRYCGARISMQYPLVELLSGLLALALWYKYGLGPEIFIYFYFTACLIIVTFIDLAHQIIPDAVSLPGVALGFLSSFLLPELSWRDSLLGILMGGGILFLVAWGYYIIARREGMGGGDIKLLAMIGAFLGWQAIPLVILLSAAVGSITGLAIMSVQKGDRHMAIPYGPFLAGAALITLFWGRELTAWYLVFISRG